MRKPFQNDGIVSFSPKLLRVGGALSLHDWGKSGADPLMAIHLAKCNHGAIVCVCVSSGVERRDCEKLFPDDDCIITDGRGHKKAMTDSEPHTEYRS